MNTRRIFVSKSEVFFDVDAVTHIFSRAADSQNMRRADAMSSDTTDDFEKNLITRFADRRAAELHDRLSRFLDKDSVNPAELNTNGDNVTAEAADTNKLTNGAVGAKISADSDVYYFVLKVENGFDDSLITDLANEIESYISTGAISDWYTAAGDIQQGGAYQQQLVPILSRIIRALVSRKFPFQPDTVFTITKTQS